MIIRMKMKWEPKEGNLTMQRTLCNATKCSCSYTASRTNGHVMLLIPCNSREYIKKRENEEEKN